MMIRMFFPPFFVLKIFPVRSFCHLLFIRQSPSIDRPATYWSAVKSGKRKNLPSKWWTHSAYILTVLLMDTRWATFIHNAETLRRLEWNGNICSSLRCQFCGCASSIESKPQRRRAVCACCQLRRSPIDCSPAIDSRSARGCVSIMRTASTTTPNERMRETSGERETRLWRPYSDVKWKDERKVQDERRNKKETQRWVGKPCAGPGRMKKREEKYIYKRAAGRACRRTCVLYL